jgi:gas vesicle structural protein
VIPARPVRRVAARRRAAQIVRSSDTSLLDVLDGLLNKGVVLNADIILALADVDLIYLRLSALLCAADRVFERP